MTLSREQQLQRVQLQDELLKRTCERSLQSFAQSALPVLYPETTFEVTRGHALLCEYLEAVTDGTITRLVVNMPPRFGKSLLVSVCWPVWEWIRRPDRKWIFSSYAERLSEQLSYDRRRLIQSDWYRSRWGSTVELAADQNVKMEFANLAGGVMLATSTGGSVTGKGGERIVIDDPHNPQQVLSEAQRQAGLDYFRGTLSTRLNNRKKDAIVVVGQRLHAQDLSGFCIEQEFTSLRLQAIAEDRTTYTFPRRTEPWVREVGHLLWPEREGERELAEARRMLGTSRFQAQYQQCPVPDGGVIFRRDGFRYYVSLPEDVDEWAVSVDLAFKGEATSDYNVLLVAARRGADIYLVDRLKGRWSFTEVCRHLETFVRCYPRVQKVYVEEAANGSALIDTLRSRISGIVSVRPREAKIVRAHAAQPQVEAGSIHLPHPNPSGVSIADREWVHDFLSQLCAFPQVAHDDDVDAFTQLVLHWEQYVDMGLTW